jgi:hypothetical protein
VPTVSTLRAKLILDAEGFNKNLDSASKKLQATGAKMRTAGRVLSLGLTTPLVAAGAAMAKLSIDAEETASKFNTVLGPAANKFNAEIAEMMKTIPATREQLQNSIADFTALGKSMGLSRESAADLGKTFTIAAADLASFNNVPGGLKRAPAAVWH